MKALGKGVSYARSQIMFRHNCAAFARTCKNLKERAILVQDYELATCLRDAQKRFEKYSETRKGKKQ